MVEERGVRVGRMKGSGVDWNRSFTVLAVKAALRRFGIISATAVNDEEEEEERRTRRMSTRKKMSVLQAGSCYRGFRRRRRRHTRGVPRRAHGGGAFPWRAQSR